MLHVEAALTALDGYEFLQAVVGSLVNFTNEIQVDDSLAHRAMVPFATHVRFC